MILVKMRYNIVWLFFLLLTAAGAYAQMPVSFDNLTVENGLSQNSVMTIAQDKQHFLWFGTRHGLNRYDGYQFKVYRNNIGNPESISNNEVESLVTDSRGVLWVGTVNGLNKYDRERDAFVRINTNSGKGLINGTINCIYEDKKHNLWVGTLRGLHLLTDTTKNIFRSFLFSTGKSQAVNNIYGITEDKHGNLWVATGDGLVCVTIKNGSYRYKQYRHNPKKPGSISSNYITCVAVDAQQNIWAGTDNGICLFNYKSGSFTIYRHSNKDPNSIVHSDIRSITSDQQGQLWIGTQEGLSILDPLTRKFQNFQHDPEQKNSISHNSVHSVFQDLNKTMWIGTYYGGVNFTCPVSTNFKIYRNSKLKSSISGNIISSVLEDKHHNLWIGTEGGGLNYLDRKNNSYEHYKTNPNNPASITSNLVKVVYQDRSQNGDLIVGTHHGGLNIFNSASRQFQRVVNVRDTNMAVGTAEIIAIRQDSFGTLWIGSKNGLSILRKSNGSYPNHTTKSALDKYINKDRKGILVLFEDRQNNLWTGTPEGLYRYNFKTKILRLFTKHEGDDTRLQSDYINCIVQLSNGQLCIGTYFGGLSIYNSKTDKFKTYTEKDGLPNNNVVGVVEDKNGNLWISTANGLSKLSPKTGIFRNYTKSDGIAGNEFNVRSYFKDSRGEIFFGGLNGLTSFFPDEIQTNNYKAPMVLTGLKLFNQNVEVNGKDELLKKAIGSTRKIVFKHDQNHFTLGFALLNYIKSDKNKYAFKLNGYDKNWEYVNTPSATYTNLPAGTYTFIVKGLNNDGINGIAPATIEIKILPPIWASWWAYLIYVLIFSIILFLTIRYLFVRALLRRSEDVQKMKLNFFTYISHEIRTPLTLILGPLESLLKSTQDNPEINQQVLPIKNNADRLMRLITELMDFRKAEAGHLNLNIGSGNIVEFTHEIFKAFEHVAATRNIQYIFDSEQQQIEAYFDRGQLEKVLFNLLSNAFKFTNDEGKISVSIEETDHLVIIKVKDNGRGIPYESQNKLFSDFFQVDEQGSSHIGSGIGLALSKSIVESHHGTIEIESSPASPLQAGDTCFTVKLQKGKAHFKEGQLRESLSQDSERTWYNIQPAVSNAVIDNEPKKPHQETVLIVEDNPEIRQMLQGFLTKDYEVKESPDGLNGWETAIELLPDLIICDVMMPVMDGLELCKKLKTDERTSHIPVILLTAKSSHIHQVDGMETGADSYVTKPFSIDLLRLNVRNLLQSRTAMRQKFSQQVNLQPQNIMVSNVDHAFMAKIVQYIEDHMADQDFGVPELATEIGMSQPVLYKKIRAITDLSVNDFIKSIRLKKAAQLLTQKVYNVSEISYLIGFNDPKYFSREFRKQYGETPKSFVNKMDQDLL